MQKFSKAQERKKWSHSLSILLYFKERYNGPCIVDSSLSFLSVYKQPVRNHRNRFLLPSDSFQSYVNGSIKEKEKVPVLFYVK